ncbi:MAG: NPCBM/NEW2 domain-containing protein [Armatimonadota bacterium]
MKTILILITATVVVSTICHAAVKQQKDDIRSWASSALLGNKAKADILPGTAFSTDFPVTFSIVTGKINKSKLPFIEFLQQDHGKFNPGKSAVNSPLQIGSKVYTHGLGTHSVSKIRVLLSKPANQFTADIGVNSDSKRGTVIFAVDVGGKEIFRSSVCKFGESPVPVSIDLKGAREFVLRVYDGGDGPDSDWADWCDAAVTYADGTSQLLDTMPVYLPGSNDCYITIPSAKLLPKWKKTHAVDSSVDSMDLHTVTYTDPDTGLKVSCEIKIYKDFPAVEWLARFTNTGSKDTAVIGAIRPLDLQFAMPSDDKAVFHYVRAHDPAPAYYVYEPVDKTLSSHDRVTLPADVTTPSQTYLPYFNLELPGGGICGGIGWTGQWEMDAMREGKQMSLKIGQQHTHLRLHPGESIRTPRVLLMSWKGSDRMIGQNLWRQLLFSHYVPHADGQVLTPLMSQMNWFILNAGGDTTEQTEVTAIKRAPAMGLEVYWLDAGWYGNGGDWGQEAGSWFPRKDHFPNGLRPLGDAAHKAGMKFMVWFEPERVSQGSQIAREHPEWVLPKQTVSSGGLFDLSNPDARAWMTILLSRSITEYGVDIYRQDRNISPFGFWRLNDTVDRQGMTEIRHVEGLYAMWDDLLRQHPGLVIDNGNWINTGPDLEVMMRSAGSWTCSENYTSWSRQQLHIASLSMFVPLHSTGLFSPDPYYVRSVSRFGASVCYDTRNSSAEQMELMKRGSDEVKMLRPLYLGDYYPLTPMNASDDNWCAWQFNRPDLGEGFVLFFRRPECPTSLLDVSLQGLDASSMYQVDFRETYDIRETKKISGKEFSDLHVDLDTKPASLLVHYRMIKE